MAYGGRGRSVLVVFVVILVGAVVGSVIGEAVQEFVPLLGESRAAALQVGPLDLVGVFRFQLSLSFDVNLAAALGMLLAAFLARRW